MANCRYTGDDGSPKKASASLNTDSGSSAMSYSLLNAWAHESATVFQETLMLARAARRSDGITMCRLASNSHPLSRA